MTSPTQTVERLRPHNWDLLSPDVQAAIDRTVATVRPAEEWDPEHCGRLAVLLGLRPRGTDAAARRSDAGG